MNKQKILKFFEEFISILSISPQKERFGEILKEAGFLKDKLSSLGFKIKFIQEKNQSPVV